MNFRIVMPDGVSNEKVYAVGLTQLDWMYLWLDIAIYYQKKVEKIAVGKRYGARKFESKAVGNSK